MARRLAARTRQRLTHISTGMSGPIPVSTNNYKTGRGRLSACFYRRRCWSALRIHRLGGKYIDVGVKVSMVVRHFDFGIIFILFISLFFGTRAESFL